MFGKESLDETLAVARQRCKARATIVGRLCAVNAALGLQSIDDVSDASTRYEDLPLKLAEQHRSLVIQRFQHTELRQRQSMRRDLLPCMCFHGGVRARQHDPELQRLI